MLSAHSTAFLFFVSILNLSAADFPALKNTETDLSKALMSPAEAAAGMKVPEGFSVSLFASEPQVQNPIAISWDAKGRMWIAENFTYAEKAQRFDFSFHDRVLILEDTDGDGKADSRKVFTDNVQTLTSVAVGRGGVWLMCPPQLLFVPDANADGTPDGAPEVMLDGFTVGRDSYHNLANGLKWGPDGWLYGRVGHSCPGRVGVPGTPDEKRAFIEGGIWRYHPERRVFESLNTGTTNPWGHDWDKHGELFFINTVIGHLWHNIPGAHYNSSFWLNPQARIYATIDQHADHYHFDTGKGWEASRETSGEDLGGGHAHVGMMIYQGDNWPSSWRDKLYTVNMHGLRVNADRLERHGSGYVGKHEPDFLKASDPWFRGLDLSVGPDGAAYLIDWSDTGECHDYTGVHRESGRIFKISHRDGKKRAPQDNDLSSLDPVALAKLQRHSNEWHVRASRQLLHERFLRGENVAAAHDLLRAQLKESDTSLRLRALWTLRLTGGMNDADLRALLSDADEHLRVWAIRWLTDEWPLDLRDAKRPAMAEVKPEPALLAELEQMAMKDESGLVRLALSSTLQRLPLDLRSKLTINLAGRAEDAADHNLPAMLWFGLMPITDTQALVPIAKATKWPELRRFIARRLTEDVTTKAAPLEALLQAGADADEARSGDVLRGMSEALKGWRKAPKPVGWDVVQAGLSKSSDPAIQKLTRDLNILFGDGLALDEVRRIALDGKAELSAREAALQILIESKPDDLRSICEKLIDARHLNAVAARGLALFDDPAIGVKLAKAYRKFVPAGRPAVIDTLVSRPAFAKALLENVGETRIPRGDITAFHARQIHSFKDDALTKKLTEVWGEVRDSSGDKAQQIATIKARLTPEILAKADLSQGRALFQVCSACHVMYGEGGKIGPDLTGSGRANLDYLLENIIDPNGVVPPDYRMSILTLKDGRILTGSVGGETDRSLTLRGLAETLTIERSEIVKQEVSPVSLMPEGLLLGLNEAQVRDLIGYLMHPTQVPLPGGGGK